MGKLLLISGGNGSGKSRYAEGLVSRTVGPRYYIATMDPQTEENRRRIQKHIAQRAGLGFVTLELSAMVQNAGVTEDSVVLLEDVSNLLANTVFGFGGTREAVWQDILALQSRCRLLVAVTIAGLSPEGYDKETSAYIDDLNDLNRRLYDASDAAVTMQDHCPIWEKGEANDVL